MSTSSHTIDTLLLDLPPDCVEFVPGSSSNFVIGTYFLETSETQNGGQEKSQRRRGQLILCRINRDDLINVTSIDTNGGAYDLHFAPASVGHPRLVGIATSTGLLSIYEVNEDTLDLRGLCRLAEPDVLITSFAWHPTIPGVVAATASTGAVVVHALDTSQMLRPADGHSVLETSPVWSLEVARHSEAAWHAAWSSSGTHLLHGGDDAVLGCARLSVTSDGPAVSNGTAVTEKVENKRIHGAGVTAVLPLDERWIITGSYDDHLRVIDMAAGQGRCVNEMRFDDGVFRLRLLQDSGSLATDEMYSAWILASCMRAGTRILKLQRHPSHMDEHNWSISEIAAHTANESLNYASACDGENIVSVSFYDQKAFLWRWDQEPGRSIAQRS